MEKHCIFCGKQPPIDKTLEHVIPKWLIKLIGDEKRWGNIGFLLEDDQLVIKNIPFDSYAFAACSDCNGQYSKLESTLREIFIRILDEGSLRGNDISTLLDWFDKIRIGLWQASLYTTKNISRIIQKYHIQTRIGKHDRALLIYKSKDAIPQLQVFGNDGPAFHFIPSCISLSVNQFCFISISKDSFLWKRMGLPFSRDSYLLPNGRLRMYLEDGTESFIHPIIKKEYDKRCVVVFQPIVDDISKKNALGHYDQGNPHTASIFKDFKNGVGKIFYYDSNDEFNEFPSHDTTSWIPSNPIENSELLLQTYKQTLLFQNYFIENGPKLDKLGEEARRINEDEMKVSLDFNKLLLKGYRDFIDFQ